eukprot:c25351_g1_i1 orf=180-2225(+)
MEGVGHRDRRWITHIRKSRVLCCWFVSVIASIRGISAQTQNAYPSTFLTIDCTVHHVENAGYLCSDAAEECHTYAYYVVNSYLLQSQPGVYKTLNDLGTKLFGTNASAIAAASNVSNHANDYLQVGEALFIPMYCQCVGNHSQENITYTIQPQDLLYKLANYTYEGLTTCQAMQDANPSVVVTDIQIGANLTFPLRCACPSKQQVNRGVKILITYPVQDGDTVDSIADMFGVATQEFLSANGLSSRNQTLFPATTVLIPSLFSEPELPKSSALSSSVTPSSSSSKVGLYLGISLAVLAVVALFIATSFLVIRKRNASKREHLAHDTTDGLIGLEKRTPIISNVQRKFVDQMSEWAGSEKFHVYTFEELKEATQNFSSSNHVRGAVYRGLLKEGVVAIKKVTRNVSQEISILQNVHHANLVKLLGVCMLSSDQSFLVYEYAENLSLSDWLHERPRSRSLVPASSSFLSWNARLQIALDVATGLQYIHDHITPSFVHKHIKSSNILLDSNFRGKIANFGLAKTANEMTQGTALTSHIVGTQGYMAPEYIIHGLVSPKVDVFAFGVVLLEMLSGEEAIIRDEEERMIAGRAGFLYESIGPVLEGSDAKAKLKRWMDPVLRNAYPLDCAYHLAHLAMSCIAGDPNSRPCTRDIAYMLAKMLETSLEWESSGLLEQNYTEHNLEGR